jgi:hypothetical protein
MNALEKYAAKKRLIHALYEKLAQDGSVHTFKTPSVVTSKIKRINFKTPSVVTAKPATSQYKKVTKLTFDPMKIHVKKKPAAGQQASL